MDHHKVRQNMMNISLFFLMTLFIGACNIPQTLRATPTPIKPTLPIYTPSPSPTPLPSDLVWFAPNMGSRDYSELFTKPAWWSEARLSIDAFKFYTQNILPYPCQICGDNTLDKFVGVEAFQKLADWDIAIAVEVGAVKPWGCTSDITFGVTREVISNIRNHGGTVAILAMDEPRVGGEETVDGVTCGYSMEESVEQTAGFIKRVRASYPKIIIGDIQAYPHFSPAAIQEWILALEERGATPSFLHMDIDVERVRVEGQNVISALQTLNRFCEEHGIPFGVIFTSNWRDAGSNQAYYESTTKWIRTVNDAIGKPQHVIFQSWQGPAVNGLHEVPINLPEDDPAVYSHTRLINEGLDMFDQ
jgi:hypothetical protein